LLPLLPLLLLPLLPLLLLLLLPLLLLLLRLWLLMLWLLFDTQPIQTYSGGHITPNPTPKPMRVVPLCRWGVKTRLDTRTSNRPEGAKRAYNCYTREIKVALKEKRPFGAD
jgi:hypothetical protein